MELDPHMLNPRDRYLLTVASVVPRPIAWISTKSKESVSNLAPFSFFGGVSSEPPTVMVSIGRRKGHLKDTSQNLLDTKEAVIHIPTRELAEKMVLTSTESDPDIDEFQLAKLAKTPSTIVKPDRVQEAALAMEAKVVHHQEVGDGPVDLFLLELLLFHAADSILSEGRPDAQKMRAVGRLGGAGYCDTQAPFDIPRPPRPAQ